MISLLVAVKPVQVGAEGRGEERRMLKVRS